jgi:hypothetical protein
LRLLYSITVKPLILLKCFAFPVSRDAPFSTAPLNLEVVDEGVRVKKGDHR